MKGGMMRRVPFKAELRRRAHGLSPRSSLPEAARTLTCLWAREMEADLPLALTTLRPAPLHDARVDSRRLRAAVSLFQGLYPGRWEQVALMAREVNRCLRRSRDLDIRCARLRHLIRGMRRPGGKDRSRLGKMLDESLASRKASSGLPGPGESASMAPLLQELWSPRVARAHQADRLVGVILKELAQRTASLIPTASVETLGGIQHRLRIRGKALRYSLEMMEWRLGEEASWRIKVLRSVQDILGEVHDIDVFAEYIGQWSKGGKGRDDSADRDMRAGLCAQRHRWFGRFLDKRTDLEMACDPAAIRARARAIA